MVVNAKSLSDKLLLLANIMPSLAPSINAAEMFERNRRYCPFG
jgi:hypothetical protein